MSRSYRHTPVAGPRANKFFKKQANRIVRRNKLNMNLNQKASYKKQYEQWKIREYKILNLTFRDYVRECRIKWNTYDKFKGVSFYGINELKKDYNRIYLRK